MDYNRRYSEEDHDRENRHPNPRNLQENQRIGKEIYRERGDRNWNEQYRSGQSYHNRDEGYGREQTHYGARPDSAYRDPSRINYGDNRQEGQNQRYGQNQDRYQNRPSGQDQTYRGYQSGYGDKRHDYYNDPPKGEHAGTRYWGEREGFKEDDYRYTSGNRGNWEAPGIGSHNRDDDDRNRYRSNYRDRHEDQDRDRGIFDRMGNSISNAWNSITGSDDDNYRNRHPRDRDYNRGYESGPRWADEDDRDNRDRQNRRRYND
jgi:hypothetical protein